MCSGEGGILPEEKAASYKYIFEYVPNLYSVTDENLKEADAIEIKIGQGTKPGMGGHLPGAKVTPEIAKIRNKPVGEDVISPSRFPNIQTKEDAKAMVDWLREVSEGRPIGIKIAAGHIEKDLEWIAYAKPDFICETGKCPVGIATQDPELRSRLHIDHAAKRLSNYLNASFEELRMFGRITGHQNIHDLSVQDLVTINREISEHTNIPHA